MCRRQTDVLATAAKGTAHPRRAEGGSQRPLSLWQRDEVQELSRRGCESVKLSTVHSPQSAVCGLRFTVYGLRKEFKV